METYRRGVVLKLSQNRLDHDGVPFVSQSLLTHQLATFYDRVSAEYMPFGIRAVAKAVDELWISLARTYKKNRTNGDVSASSDNETVKDIWDYICHYFPQVFALLLLFVVSVYFLPSCSSPEQDFREEMCAFIDSPSATFALGLLVLLLIASAVITLNQLWTSSKLAFSTIVDFLSEGFSISLREQSDSDEEECIAARWRHIVALSILLVCTNFLPLYSPTTEDFLRLRSSIVSPLGSFVWVFLILLLIASASLSSAYLSLTSKFSNSEFVCNSSNRRLTMVGFLIKESSRKGFQNGIGRLNNNYEVLTAQLRSFSSRGEVNYGHASQVTKILEQDPKMWTLSCVVRIFTMPPVGVIRSYGIYRKIGPVLSAACSVVVGISWDIFVDLDALTRKCVALSYIGGSFFFLCVAIIVGTVEVGST